MTDYTVNRIREFILDDHPCVMAQSMVLDDTVQIISYNDMNDPSSITMLLEDLRIYVERQDLESKDFNSFIAVFKNNRFASEVKFEDAMWKLLHELFLLDKSEWDVKTSSDPDDHKFSFSLHATSFYVVGLHPMSSRFARTSPYTMLVFNLHEQFELLRKMNRYKRVRNLIRRRDKAYQGSINPMLEDFGKNSEARQYSGRAVENEWKCPYNFKKS